MVARRSHAARAALAKALEHCTEHPFAADEVTLDLFLSKLWLEGFTLVALTGELQAFCASDAACYLWPDDTPEHKNLRAAYIAGAASVGT